MHRYRRSPRAFGTVAGPGTRTAKSARPLPSQTTRKSLRRKPKSAASKSLVIAGAVAAGLGLGLGYYMYTHRGTKTGGPGFTAAMSPAISPGTRTAIFQALRKNITFIKNAELTGATTSGA